MVIAKEKHEAETQLQETMPALLEAQQGLDTLKAADITEMRSFANPVDALRLIGYCMLIYLGHSSISWKDVRSRRLKTIGDASIFPPTRFER